MAESRRERLTRLRDTIRIARHTTLDNLAASFGVSTATIRRDIKILEVSGEVIQTLGGGVRHQADASLPLSGPQPIRAIDEKIRIAEYCSELVEENDDVIIGPGLTALIAGRIMSGLTDRCFRIITSSLELALETSRLASIRTVVLGGDVRGGDVLPPAGGYEYLSRCHRDHLLVMSADGLDSDGSVTVFDPALAPVYEAMMAVAGRVVLAIDSDSVGRTRHIQVATAGQLTSVVTDGRAQREVVQTLRDRGIEVVLVHTDTHESG